MVKPIHGIALKWNVIEKITINYTKRKNETTD